MTGLVTYTDPKLYVPTFGRFHELLTQEKLSCWIRLGVSAACRKISALHISAYAWAARG